jgi:sugar lactone lactonase YvrE
MREFIASPCTTDLYSEGECCRWDDMTSELQWVDVPNGTFYRARADGTRIEIIRTYTLDGYLTAFAPLEDREDGWIIASNQSISLLDVSGEACEVADPEGHNGGEVLTNDGAADPWGRFWVGSMAVGALPDRGSLYRYHETTGAHVVLEGITISNGIGWSPDGRTMYYVDSGPGTIHAFDMHPSGEITDKRLFAQFDVAREGTPDGLCLDAEGALWVALWGGHEVRRLAPSGEQLARVSVDTIQPSSCALGGTNGTTLYVTTAQTDLSPEALRDDPNAGRLFCVDVGVTGQPLLPYRPRLRSQL